MYFVIYQLSWPFAGFWGLNESRRETYIYHPTHTLVKLMNFVIAKCENSQHLEGQSHEAGEKTQSF